ncbi:hypothetical protein ACU8KI_02410 [Rhizobium leguminosarum]
MAICPSAQLPCRWYGSEIQDCVTTTGAEQFFNKIIVRDAAFDEQVRRVMPDEGVAGHASAHRD